MPGSSDIDPTRLEEQIESLPAIRQLGQIAERVPAYLVGGVVRDLLLGRDVTDLDVAIEGDAEALNELPGFSLERDALLPHRAAGAGRREDRRRTDPGGELPGAGRAPRGAARLDRRGPRPARFHRQRDGVPAERGAGEHELLDPHHGLDDLRAGLLRILHEGSFVDDPTRALRAARYAARFGFELEPETERLLRQADLTTISEDRIGKELRHIAGEDDPAAALRLIADWEVLSSLDPEAPDRVAEVTRLATAPPWSGWVDRQLAVMLAIVRPLPQIRELAAATPERPSEAVRLAATWDAAQLLVARALGAEWLDRYAADWRQVRLEITGEDLLAAGVPEGPAVGRGLEAALSGKLDGEISGREEELRIALAAASGEIPED